MHIHWLISPSISQPNAEDIIINNKFREEFAFAICILHTAFYILHFAFAFRNCILQLQLPAPGMASSCILLHKKPGMAPASLFHCHPAARHFKPSSPVHAVPCPSSSRRRSAPSLTSCAPKKRSNRNNCGLILGFEMCRGLVFGMASRNVNSWVQSARRSLQSLVSWSWQCAMCSGLVFELRSGCNQLEGAMNPFH